jgi:hypothetical protein
MQRVAIRRGGTMMIDDARRFDVLRGLYPAVRHRRTQRAWRDRSPAEAIMFTKVMLGVIAAILVIITLAALQALNRSTAVSPAAEHTAVVARLTGADWYERHPSVAAVDQAIFAGSDWHERHGAALAMSRFAGSDWHERHSSR